MPPKKGKKTKEKKAAKTGPTDAGQLVERLLSVYEKRCVAMQGLPCMALCQTMRQNIEANTLLVRVRVMPFWREKKCLQKSAMS